MTVLTIATCPHCSAEMEAFHHTRWDTLESNTDMAPEFCPACSKPLDPRRAAWQEAAGSGKLHDEAKSVLEVIAAVAVVGAIVGLTVGFYFSRHPLYGLAILALLAGFALVLAWRGASRPEKESPLIEFELLPHAPGSAPGPPAWDTKPLEGVRAIVPPPRDKKIPEGTSRTPATRRRKSSSRSPDEIARRIALAWLEPKVDHPILRHLKVHAEQTTQWPAMRPAEADRKFGAPAAIGRDGTRAYVTPRPDGRGTLSLLQCNGTERVLRFEMTSRRRPR